MTALETALQYAGRGWRVIPCRSKISRVRNWQVAASCDPETIITWWTEWPNAWIALLCGCGFVVIDVDTGEAHNNVDGFGTLAQLGPLPETRCVRTPTGGMHIYLQSDQPVRSRVIGPGLELRAANQYVIAPPSPGYVVIYECRWHGCRIGCLTGQVGPSRWKRNNPVAHSWRLLNCQSPST